MALDELGELLLEFGDPIAPSVVLLVTRGAIVHLLGGGAPSLIHPSAHESKSQVSEGDTNPSKLRIWILGVARIGHC